MYINFGAYTTEIPLLTRIDDLVYNKLNNPDPEEGDYVLDSLKIYIQELNNTIQVHILFMFKIV